MSLPALFVSVLALSGCAGAPQDRPESAAPSAPSAAAEDITLTVFAAASLGESFEQLGERFTEEHPGVEVQFNFAGSSGLVEQLAAGAPADVFASADEPNMARAVENGDMTGGEDSADPVDFATNVLTLVTPADNPAGISSLEDAAQNGVDLVVCAPQVPCGNATGILAEDAGLTLQPVSEESSVTDVLGKVVSGQADAGLVYVTDALRAGDDVQVIELENAEVAVNLYPIGVTAGAQHPETAREFVTYVTGPEGRQVLADAGFGLP